MLNIFWLFTVTTLLPICMSTWQNHKYNLTENTWFNAVNTQDLLKEALKSDVDFLEADVFIGYHERAAVGEKIPVMGEPSDKMKSDLSLEEFMAAVKEHNTKNPNNEKAIKLDFKTTKAVTESVEILKKDWKNMKFPVFINADILEGPGGSGDATPVDAKQFFESVNQLQGAILSVGWTTHWTPNTTEYYSQDEALNMMQTIDKSIEHVYGHIITFSVRAAFAGHFLSKQSMARLAHYYRKNMPTFTIWSSENGADVVDVKELEEFIRFFGVARVFTNFPQNLRDQLDLSKSGANSLYQFGNLNLVTFSSTLIIIRSLFVQ